MSARELNKRIKLYQKQNEFDGFAGQTASKDILLTETWAKIETFNATKTSGLAQLVDFGINATQNVVKIVMRYRKDLKVNSTNMYFVYAGVKYTIASYPVEVGFRKAYLSFLAYAAIDYSNEIQTPVDTNAIYENYYNSFNVVGGSETAANNQKYFINQLLSG